jgi:primosomal protein N' (replication factor Y)
MIQTFMPDHEVIQAALLADPARLLSDEQRRRELLGLPPARALASVTGAGSDAVADQLRAMPGVTVGGAANNFLVTAPTWELLGRALVAVDRPRSSRVRIAVDPPRV